MTDLHQAEEAGAGYHVSSYAVGWRIDKYNIWLKIGDLPLDKQY
jgi:hypothetical protein